MSKAPRTFRILIVDDHPLVREGLRLRLSTQPDMQVCGEAATEDEAVALAKQFVPDLMLIDISLKIGHGLELVKRIRAQHPRIKMLVISGYEESLYGERALRAGALGYLNKQESNERLLEAIHTVMSGRRFVSATLAQQLVGLALGEAPATLDPMKRLTDRELQVFGLIGQGVKTSAIADQLFISTHTVDSHREHIKDKLGFANAGELNRAAVQWVLENG
jgi:DNA-binding NarL/FixJ family response regulator